MFKFLNHHNGRTDESAPLSFADVLTLAMSWSILFDDEWIGFRPVGAHAAEIVVWQRGPFINPLRKLDWQRRRESR